MVVGVSPGAAGGGEDIREVGGAAVGQVGERGDYGEVVGVLEREACAAASAASSARTNAKGSGDGRPGRVGAPRHRDRPNLASYLGICA